MKPTPPQAPQQGQVVAFPAQLEQAVSQHINELAQVELRLSELGDEKRKLSARKHELRGIIATLRTLTPIPPKVANGHAEPAKLPDQQQPEAPATTQ